MASTFEHVWSSQGVESWLLSPLSVLYAVGWLGYQSVYALGLKKPFEPHTPVVTVGNLIAGGSGKTPTTLFVEQVLRSLGRQVVLSVSGYGAPRAQHATLAPDGELAAATWGDEAAMLRMFRPTLPIVVGRDRVEAAHIVAKVHPDAVMLMDDGFQHLRLKQHVTIVLDAQQPNRFCLPGGPYREPRGSGRRRADLVLPSDEFEICRSATKLVSVTGEQDAPHEFNVLCAVARPYRLTEELEKSGHRLKTVRFLPDHDPLTAGTLLDGFDLATPLLVTAKDWVKLKARNDLHDRQIWMASYDVTIEPQEAFADWLRRRIDGLGEQATA